jgi:hypothetical protein
MQRIGYQAVSVELALNDRSGLRVFLARHQQFPVDP